MSANIFPMIKSKESRIPVPSQSPQLLRRSRSLRLKPNDNLAQFEHRDADAAAVITTTDRGGGNGAFLRRGNSFMERGERRSKHGVPSITTTKLEKSPVHDGKIANKMAKNQQSPSSRTRSLSLSISTAHLNTPRSPTTVHCSPRTPPTSPDVRNFEWDTESLASATSLTSVGSCEHASVAKNGTTFSGRSMKYVFHCNQHSGVTGEDYLTPTQRVHRQVKKLQYLLHQAKKDLEQKDSDILKLTKEVVELRLYKAALSSPEDKSTSSDVITIRENTDEDATPDGNLPVIVNQTDSGHFEDFTNTITIQDGASSEVPPKLMVDKSVMVDSTPEQQQLILEYEKRFQELIKTHEEESLQLKQKHNDKIDELLQRITEINHRYWELVPELDLAKAKIKELESQLEEAVQKLQQHDEEQQQKQKEQEEQQKQQQEETVRLQQEIKVMEVARQGPSRISVPELLQQLQVTKNELDSVKDYEFASSSNNLQPLLSAKEALALWVLGARKAMYRQLMEARNKNKIDPEITLQFLKSAIYYFLTDKENSQGHLKAIQSILGFSASEISSIERARMT